MSELEQLKIALDESERREAIAVQELNKMRKRAEEAEKFSQRSRIYISGPITGFPIEEVARRFSRIEKALSLAGFDPINPLNNGLPTDASYNEHMLRDLDLLAECKSIYMLKGWENSKGARIEFAEAVSKKMTIVFER